MHELLVVDVEHQHGIDLSAELRQHSAHALGLRSRAHDAIEQRAGRELTLGERLLHDAEDDLIRDEVAALHEGFGGKTHRRPGAKRGAENVARGYGWDAKRRGDARRLCPLTCSGLTKKYNVHWSGIGKWEPGNRREISLPIPYSLFP